MRTFNDTFDVAVAAAAVAGVRVVAAAEDCAGEGTMASEIKIT